jgi:hypothetical protein
MPNGAMKAQPVRFSRFTASEAFGLSARLATPVFAVFVVAVIGKPVFQKNSEK